MVNTSLSQLLEKRTGMDVAASDIKLVYFFTQTKKILSFHI